MVAIIAKDNTNPKAEYYNLKTWQDVVNYRRKMGMKVGAEYHIARKLKIKIPKTK